MATNLEEARGKDIVVRFDTQRCIHARHCVLGHPEVFQANMQGPWIDPEAASPERTAAVVQTCPSGALSYERLDGGLQESPPLVNVIRIRENGPLAVVADLRIVNEAPMIRATLCRCGRSKNKPFCDSAHVAMGFKASGEPPSNGTPALATGGGLLELVPLKDGPLQINGNVELCTGTGRTITRVQETYLCRCGSSANKPFCDGSHAKIGFVAEGD
jgi:CDGSH-type Zn-finger protein/uncharacterized Fe-S cluster protein YjdI